VSLLRYEYKAAGGRRLRRGRSRGIRKAVVKSMIRCICLMAQLIPMYKQSKLPSTAARHMNLNDFRRSFDRLQITEEDDDVYLVL
jgi:hypothetical protein